MQGRGFALHACMFCLVSPCLYLSVSLLLSRSSSFCKLRKREEATLPEADWLPVTSLFSRERAKITEYFWSRAECCPHLPEAPAGFPTLPAQLQTKSESQPHRKSTAGTSPTAPPRGRGAPPDRVEPQHPKAAPPGPRGNGQGAGHHNEQREERVCTNVHVCMCSSWPEVVCAHGCACVYVCACTDECVDSGGEEKWRDRSGGGGSSQGQSPGPVQGTGAGVGVGEQRGAHPSLTEALEAQLQAGGSEGQGPGSGSDMAPTAGCLLPGLRAEHPPKAHPDLCPLPPGTSSWGEDPVG